MKPGQVRRSPPLNRKVRGHVLLHIPVEDRPTLHAALTKGHICIWQPGYRRDREDHYRPSMSDPLPMGGIGKQEVPIFLWMNFCRYRLFQTLDAARSRPIGVRLCRELIRWTREAYRVRDQIIVSNRPLSISLARRFTNRADYVNELMGEAAHALVCAVDFYNANNGASFSSYAFVSIWRNLLRLDASLRRRGAHEVCQFEPELEPKSEPPSPTKDYDLDRLDLRMILETNAADLDDREREVLDRRFGLGDHDRETLTDAATALGVSRETIRQVELSGINKLRELMGV